MIEPGARQGCLPNLIGCKDPPPGTIPVETVLRRREAGRDGHRTRVAVVAAAAMNVLGREAGSAGHLTMVAVVAEVVMSVLRREAGRDDHRTRVVVVAAVVMSVLQREVGRDDHHMMIIDGVALMRDNQVLVLVLDVAATAAGMRILVGEVHHPTTSLGLEVVLETPTHEVAATKIQGVAAKRIQGAGEVEDQAGGAGGQPRRFPLRSGTVEGSAGVRKRMILMAEEEEERAACVPRRGTWVHRPLTHLL